MNTKQLILITRGRKKKPSILEWQTLIERFQKQTKGRDVTHHGRRGGGKLKGFEEERRRNVGFGSKLESALRW